jgi:hypothetical protein
VVMVDSNTSMVWSMRVTSKTMFVKAMGISYLTQNTVVQWKINILWHVGS